MKALKQGIITKVSGPLVIAKGMEDANMFDVVKVSSKNLIGEIIEMNGGNASIQVYEETSGVGPGEKIIQTGMPLSVELGPGMLTSIYDGIQRPLEKIYENICRLGNLGLENNIAIGSDFDGADMPPELSDISKVPDLYTYLEKRGISAETLKKIFYENAQNYFDKLSGI